MNTSELAARGPLSTHVSPSTPAELAVAAGLPDQAALEQLANAFFKADALPKHLPETAAVLATRAGAQGANASPIPLQQHAPSVTELELRSLPASLKAAPTAAHATALTAQTKAAGEPSLPAPAQQAAAVVPATPGIVGGINPGHFTSEADFGFLREARSIFGAVPPVPTPELPKNVPAIPATPTALTTPQIPGAVTHASIPAPPPDVQLRQAPTAPLAIDVVPRLDPVPASPGTADAVRLSSIPFDVQAIRRDFPILQERVNGRQLIWLDNAATTQKPQQVIDRISYFYQHENSNIHRAAHTLAARATDAYEAARDKVRRFLNAGSTKEIIFVRGATEAINLIAQTYGKRHVQRDDEIVVTHLEHHANIVPWQMLAAEKGARIRVAPVDDSGQILLDEFEKLFTPRTKIVSIAHVSNALGTITPVQEMVAIAHRHGAVTVVDGAQAVSHMPVDVQAIGADFYVFSGHKVFGPTGIGVVYGKQNVIEHLPPYQGGGNMIADVTFEKTLYQPAPMRFEAGTGNIADAVGLGAAIDYVERLGMINIGRYEHDLLVYATEQLREIPGLHLIGTAKEKASVLSFVLDGFRTEDVGAALNQEGIAVRSGHHCAQPILRRFGVEATVRPSLAFYNTCEEVDALVAAIWNLKSGRHPGV